MADYDEIYHNMRAEELMHIKEAILLLIRHRLTVPDDYSRLYYIDQEIVNRFKDEDADAKQEEFKL